MLDPTRPSPNQFDRQPNGALLIKERKVIVTCLAILGSFLLIGSWIGHQTLFKGVALLWVASDVAQPADAVAIFGGGIETRPLAAAEYFRRGLAHKILVSGVYSGNEAESSHTRQNLGELRKLGVPDSIIEIFGCNSSNTYQEALALREWSQRSGAHSLIIPTESFSARRVRWITQRVFQDTGVQVQIPVIGSLDDLLRADSSDALFTFQREVIKYLGYQLIHMVIPAYRPGSTSEPCRKR
jgi:uncharacterized SAM-binding protein YcdF (DUF218 family)